MEQRVLGDYRIIKLIGQGTLGAVYLAEHRFMKRNFALKVLPEELGSDRGFIQRFEEEVGRLCALEHPNIVKMYNISYAQGQYFLVLDCVVDEMGETTNLAKYLLSMRNRLSEDDFYSILYQVAIALDYAHAKESDGTSFVHRGLKLNNVLVGKHQGEHKVYLSDFGLSYVIGSGAVLTRTIKNVAEAIGIAEQLMQKGNAERYITPSVEASKLTPLHTSFLQTYAFLAPEQKRIDKFQLVDAAVDRYAFGVLVYFILMNELPEGIFSMPSSLSCYKYQWDELITSLLQFDPNKRPKNLLSVLEAVKSPKTILPRVAEPQDVQVKCSQVEEPVLKREEHTLQESSFSSLKDAEDKGCNREPSLKLKPVLQTSEIQRPQTDLNPGAVFQVNQLVQTYSPERKDVSEIKPVLTDMVVIPGGSFFRGSSDGNRDEMPRHPVVLSSFAMDIHPVTNEQFVRFLEVMGGEKDNNHNDIIRLRDSRIKRSAGKLTIESGYAKHPVVGVTWYGAVAYAKWVGKRLPTEAEWEIAAKGGNEEFLYPTGKEIEKSLANFFSTDTTAVMSYSPNSRGIYDMAGNVYEWCHDWYGYNYYEISQQEPNNPQGPHQGVYRVLRGGCWKSLKDDLRCSRRHRNNPGAVNSTYGFRCASAVE